MHPALPMHWVITASCSAALLLILSYPAGAAQVPMDSNTRKRAQDQDTIGKTFAQFCYRPYTVAHYIKGTSPWKDGRRKVLDWGAGGGRLAQVLAEQGAEQVVAVDLHPDAVQTANALLEPLPHAQAVHPTSTTGWIDSICVWRRTPGREYSIRYRSKFDIVVSFCGAFSLGTLSRCHYLSDKPPTLKQALQQAVRACRRGGCVVMGQGLQVDHVINLAGLALACGIGWARGHMGRPEDKFLPWWVTFAFWQFMSSMVVNPRKDDTLLALSLIHI